MPPKFPHGLKHNPIIMNTAEKTVFAMLGVSITAGLFMLATSPLYEKAKKSDGEDDTKEKTHPSKV